MKKTLVLLWLSLTVLFASAQDVKVPQPEFSDLPYAWVKNSNELIMLSKEKADMKIMGMGTKMAYKYKGKTSSVKIKNTDNISFLISTTMPAILSSMSLYKLEVKKKYRYTEVVQAKFGGAEQKDENTIAMNHKKIEGDVYELVLMGKMIPGEYVFTNGNLSYTFSVE